MDKASRPPVDRAVPSEPTYPSDRILHLKPIESEEDNPTIARVETVYPTSPVQKPAPKVTESIEPINLPVPKVIDLSGLKPAEPKTIELSVPKATKPAEPKTIELSVPKAIVKETKPPTAKASFKDTITVLKSIGQEYKEEEEEEEESDCSDYSDASNDSRDQKEKKEPVKTNESKTVSSATRVLESVKSPRDKTEQSEAVCERSDDSPRDRTPTGKSKTITGRVISTTPIQKAVISNFSTSISVDPVGGNDETAKRGGMAFKTIKTAVANAYNGDAVNVSPGRYKVLSIKGGVSIYGTGSVIVENIEINKNEMLCKVDGVSLVGCRPWEVTGRVLFSNCNFIFTGRDRDDITDILRSKGNIEFRNCSFEINSPHRKIRVISMTEGQINCTNSEFKIEIAGGANGQVFRLLSNSSYLVAMGNRVYINGDGDNTVTLYTAEKPNRQVCTSGNLISCINKGSRSSTFLDSTSLTDQLILHPEKTWQGGRDQIKVITKDYKILPTDETLVVSGPVRLSLPSISGRIAQSKMKIKIRVDRDGAKLETESGCRISIGHGSPMTTYNLPSSKVLKFRYSSTDFTWYLV